MAASGSLDLTNVKEQFVWQKTRATQLRMSRKNRDETHVASHEGATTPSTELWGYIEGQRVQAEERQEKIMLAMQTQFADLFKMQMEQQKMQLEQQII